MTCLEVRERLGERALGLLSRAEAADVDRHLEWCAGCRKEAAELSEGAATVALALTPAKPPSSLEERILEGVMTVAGRSRPPARHRVRALVATTLAAALLAVGAMGWAVAERGHVQSLRELVQQKNLQVRDLGNLITVFQGKTFQATMLPPAGAEGGGSALIFSAPNANLIYVDVVLPEGARTPFALQLVDDQGAVRLGNLQKKDDGGWFLFESPGRNLSRVVTVTVLDAGSNTLLTGTVRLHAAG